MYRPKHFILEELVPEMTHRLFGDKAWEFLDERALMVLDRLREKFGSITVNNWKWGGPRQWSGLRTEESPYGTQYSQHRAGRAFDCVFKAADPETVRTYILEHPEEFPEIGGLELGTPTWVHFDVRHHDGIKAFYP